MQNVYECLESCKSNSLIRLREGATYTIADLILSSTAVGPGVTHEKVSQAINELIQLQYPLINRILEMAASLCANKFLFIYITNSAEFESLKTCEHNHGYFDPNRGIIVVSTRTPLSEVLIHELTHAVRHYLMFNPEIPGRRHQEFCKREFPDTMRNAMKDKEATPAEQDELADIEYKAGYVGQTTHVLMKGRTFEQQTEIFNLCRERSDIFNVRRQKITDRQRFRREFYELFKLYNDAERSEEFLPFFLQSFVRFTCHEKLRSFESWVNKYLQCPSKLSAMSYNSEVLQMMWWALPEKLMASFVKGDFRAALDQYVALYVNRTLGTFNVSPLEDGCFYAGTLAEPARTDNTFYRIKD